MGGEDKDRETSARRDDDAGGAGDGEDRREGRTGPEGPQSQEGVALEIAIPKIQAE